MQNHNFKNIFHFFVIIWILLGMAACSIEETPSPTQISQSSSPVPMENNQNSDPVPTQVVTPLINPAVEYEDVTITFITYELYRPIIEPLIEEFHQVYPSITVDFLPVDASNYNEYPSMEDYYQALAAKADSTNLLTSSSAGKVNFIDLQPLMDADPYFNQDDFYPGSLSACKDPQGIVRGIPVSISIGGIFYNRSAFDAANIAYPQPGWTWDDFRNDITLLTQTQGSVTRFGFVDRSYYSILESIIGINLEKNGGVIDEKSLSTELQWYVDMAQSGQLLMLTGISDDAQMKLSYESWQAMFKNNNGPALWYGGLISDEPGVDGDTNETSPLTNPAIASFGFLPFPISGDGFVDNTTPTYSDCFVISASSPYPNETWQWLSFLSQHLRQQWFDRQRRITGELLVLPARQSVAEVVGFWEGFSVENQTSIRFGLDHAWYEGISRETVIVVLAAVEKAANNGADLTQAIAEAKAQLKTAH